MSTFPHAEGYVKNNANNYVYHYIYKDHLGNVRLSYADVNGNGTIEPATEIIEENNYYPFGLKHKGYNEIANSNRSEEAEAYKFLNREYEDSFGLNVIETDFRQYDAALGRFNVMDMLSEIAPGHTPYRYGFNNPVFWQDATGLFETYGQAMKFLEDNNLNGKINFYDANDWSKGFVVTVIGGEFDGTTFYNFSELLPDVIVGSDGDGSGGGSDSGSSFGRGEPSAMNASSGALAMGELTRQAKAYQFFGKTAQQVEDALANGKYVHKNGKVYSQKFRGNQYVSSQSVKNSLGTARFLKSAGKVMTGVSIGIAGYQFYESDKSGADYARLTGAAIITASAFIPVVGPFISIGLGVADSFGAFDSLYNSFD